MRDNVNKGENCDGYSQYSKPLILSPLNDEAVVYLLIPVVPPVGLLSCWETSEASPVEHWWVPEEPQMRQHFQLLSCGREGTDSGSKAAIP